MRVFRHIAPSDRPVALAIGNFDGVHLGHQALLAQLCAQASNLGLVPSVMTFEPHPREFFSPATAPSRLTSLREKLELFAEIGVEQVYLCRFNQRFASMQAPVFIEQVLKRMPARLVLVGDDFRFGAGRQGTLEDLKSQGFDVRIMQNVAVDQARVSSTAIRLALAAGELSVAEKLLGRHYSVSGHIGHGDKLGRQLGYPTANIYMLHERPPLFGIYAVKLSGLGGQELPGVASLGVRPTMKHDAKPLLEVHLFDFNQDIYGRHVRVHFLKKLRDEEKFPTLEALRLQIVADEQAARDYFKTLERNANQFA
jgi:riboflavin kinase/FMN adenylyltransferase